MNKILLIPFLLISLPLLSQTKHKDIQNLLITLEIKNTMQSVVDNGLELFKKKKPAVPQQVWHEIRNSVDYNSYLEKVTSIFDNNYSQSEIKQLIKQAVALKPKQPPFKNSVQQQLYDTGKTFGQKLAASIQTQLKNKGF